MTPQEFSDWKRHPVTQVVMSQLASRVAELKDVLAYNAGVNPTSDREIVGAIKAYTDMLEIQYEGEQSA